MAKEFGLVTSIAGFDAAAYEGDLEKELSTVGKEEHYFLLYYRATSVRSPFM